jgi:hypothetical protein
MVIHDDYLDVNFVMILINMGVWVMIWVKVDKGCCWGWVLGDIS